MLLSGMFKKVNFHTTAITAAIAGVAFSIPVYFYLLSGDYTRSWLLYIGSFLFLIVMWIHTLYESRRRGDTESTVTLVFIAHVAAVAGIIVACLLSFILLVILVPGYLGPGMASKVLSNEPANTIIDKTQGLSFNVFMAATIINFSVGSFTGIVLPFYSKRAGQNTKPDDKGRRSAR